MSGIPNFVAAYSAADPMKPNASCITTSPGRGPAAGAAADAPDALPDVDAVISLTSVFGLTCGDSTFLDLQLSCFGETIQWPGANFASKKQRARQEKLGTSTPTKSGVGSKVRYDRVFRNYILGY